MIAATHDERGADPQALRRTMSLFATGVTVVLAERSTGEVHGMTANAISSISLDPPLIMVSVANESTMREVVETAGAFSVNILKTDQAPLANLFAGRLDPAEDVPEASFESSTDGVPILQGSLSWLRCDLYEMYPAGDHTIVLGRVCGMASFDGPPLLFFEGKWNTLPADEDVFVVDRKEFRARMDASLKVWSSTTAVVLIDMIRGFLDEDIATVPIPSNRREEVLVHTQDLLSNARELGLPVVYVNLGFEEGDMTKNPFLRAAEECGASLVPTGTVNLSEHALVGTPQIEIMPEIAPINGEVVLSGKKRPSAFYGTGLDGVLSGLEVDTLVIGGINTNTSIMNTALDAYNRDLTVVVARDCVTSMYGDDLHRLALKNIQYCIGWVLDSYEIAARMAAPSGAAVNPSSDEGGQ